MKGVSTQHAARAPHDKMEDENENVDKEDFLTAPYACDEITKDGFVRVAVWVKGLKVSSDIVFKGIVPSRVKKLENAKVDVSFEERSFCLTVFGESGDLKWKNIRVKICKLPHDIIPDKCYYEISKEKVYLFLCKKQDRSWYPGMQNGLETAEEDEEEEEGSTTRLV